jgi:DNA repair exonuclease SbcCD ATPase subunit
MESVKNDQTRLVRAEVQNVLGIRLAEVKFDPDGGLIVIGGENGAGKSSLLDALRWALDGSKPKGKELLRHGTDKGTVVIELAGEIVEIKRSVTEKGAYVKVTGENGSDIKAPQKVLDALVGTFGIDPTEFLTLNDEQQAKRVQEVMGVDFADLDAKHKQLYEERTNWNRRVRDADGELRNLPRPDPGDPTESVVLSDLVTNITEAEKLERSFEDDAKHLETLRSESAEYKSEIETLEKRIATLREKRSKVVEEGKHLVTMIDENNVVMVRNREAGTDVAGLRDKLANAETINARVAVGKRRAEAEDKVRKLGIEAEKVDKELENIQAERAKRISEAPLSIEGVDIRDGVVFYNDAPLSEASDGQRLRVAFEIAAAGNPKLKIMFLRHGALLDSKNRKMVSELACERGYTVVMEVVGTSGIDVFIEDGVSK